MTDLLYSLRKALTNPPVVILYLLTLLIMIAIDALTAFAAWTWPDPKSAMDNFFLSQQLLIDALDENLSRARRERGLK